jgi:glycerol-3-phosphate cytidylyltransferase
LVAGSTEKIRVYVYVVADLFHTGHLRAIKNATKYGNYVIVGVLTDEATMEKKPEPIMPYEERLEIVKAIKYVDEAIPQDTYSPLGNVMRLKPNVLMESDDHKEMPANEFVESYGGKVVITPYYKPLSSTKIKNKIAETWKK